MSSGNFIDQVRIHCRSGSGGPGSVHFRREKFIPKGGPDGGDGGRGGHIILKGNKQLWTLLHLRYRKHMIADNGKPGEGGKRSGAQGTDIILEVPTGTLVKSEDSGEKVLEIINDGEEKILVEGGMGGLGNDHFKTATNQAPRHAQPGGESLEGWYVFELKLLADVGLVGFPNAGKSTLLSVVSAARPEIADYPFTTLTPNLGVVAYRDHQSFVMADIPGIIEGAAEGKGIGLRFLRHIERNSILLFLVSSDSNDINKEYETLLNELTKYNPQLLDKNRLLVISKSDLLDSELKEEIVNELPGSVNHHFISSVANHGIDQLKDKIWQLLNKN